MPTKKALAKRITLFLGIICLVLSANLALGQSATCNLIFENRSQNQSSVCIYQEPLQTSPHARNQIWFCQPFSRAIEGGKTQVNFEWEENYYFTLEQTGNIGKISFIASQTFQADLNNKNQITLDKNQEGIYYLTNPNYERREYSATEIIFTIRQTQNVVRDEALIGIGMSGKPIASIQSSPNLTAVFKVSQSPTYGIFWGNYRTGEIIDIRQITNKEKIAFPPGIKSIRLVLLEDNTWCQEGKSYRC